MHGIFECLYHYTLPGMHLIRYGIVARVVLLANKGDIYRACYEGFIYILCTDVVEILTVKV